MRNFTNQIIVAVVILATLSSQVVSQSRMRTRNGAGVRGRREGETNGGYGRNSASPPALYSAPKLTTFQSVKFEQTPAEPVSQAPGLEDVESLDGGTTTELSCGSCGDESPLDQEVLEDSTMEAATQAADATESSSSAANEGSGRDGTTEIAMVATDGKERPNGLYLTPKNLARLRDSFNGDNSISLPPTTFYKSNGGNGNGGGYQNALDSSAAFSSYYSSHRSAARPIDQQQVENFNYQQYTQQNANPNAFPSQEQSSASGYNQNGQRNQQQQQQQPEPSYEQIAALEKSYYSNIPGQQAAANVNGGNNGGYSNNGYPNQNHGNNAFQQQQPQLQQQYIQQSQPQQQYPQPQPQFRYIAQQPEQFYPTPGVGPVQQYLPINPLISGRQQEQNVQGNQGGISYSFPDPPPPAHIQSNIAEVVHQNIAEPQPQFQQRSDTGGQLMAMGADYPNQDQFGNGINVDDDSMDITFEGLNDNVVDAELLERVQQIIEEHERQQQEFLQSQRNSNQNQYDSPAPVNEVVGPNGLVIGQPKPSIQYEVDTRNGNGQNSPQSYARSLQQPQPVQNSFNGNNNANGGGYGFGNEVTPQAPMRFSQQLQQHQAFNGNGNGGRGQSRALQGKKINNLDVQPAILTQHFMESGTPSNLHRQTFTQRQPQPRREQTQEMAYLPPRNEYSNSERRPQPPPPQFQDNQHSQQQQLQQTQGGYQQPQPQVLSQYAPQQIQQSQQQQFSGFPQGFQPAQDTPYYDTQFPSQGAPPPGATPFRPSEPDLSYAQPQQPNEDANAGGQGGFTQQFRQEYSRPQQEAFQAQPQNQQHAAPQQAYPNYQHNGNGNSIDSDDNGGYDSPPRPNIITKTIVIHEQPAPTYDGQYPAGISNRAIITADDLRGSGLGGITISMQRPQVNSQPQPESNNNYAADSGSAPQEHQSQYMALPQYMALQAMSQLAVDDEIRQQQPQKPSMIYLPIYQQPEPQPQPLQQQPIQIQMPKPVYGIPLAPALGPESLSSLPPSTYGQPQYQTQPQQQQQQHSTGNGNGNQLTYFSPQYSNSLDSSSEQSQSQPVQDSAPQQSKWDSALHTIYRLPNVQSDDTASPSNEGSPSLTQSNSASAQDSTDRLRLTNPIQLVSQIVSTPNSDSPTPSDSTSETSSGYGTRIDSSRRSIRKRFSHAISSPLTHRHVSVKTRAHST